MSTETQSLKSIQEESHNIPGVLKGQKRKQKEKESDKFKADPTSERNIVGVSIDIKDRVTLDVVEIITIPPYSLEGESTRETRTYKMVSEDKPHPDLTDALKCLRKPALEICDFDIPEAKKLHDFTVVAVKISGDLLLKQARVVLTLGKLVRRTEKVIKIKGPQTTLYGQSEYENADKLAPLVERVIAEATEYMYGKYEDTNPNQLPLFER